MAEDYAIHMWTLGQPCIRAFLASAKREVETLPGHASRVFVGYRREEARHLAGRLADRMADRFGPGQVFMDVDTIEPGADFVAAITHAVTSCDLLIVIIGREWLTIRDEYQRRKLDNPDDVVVLEITTALENNIRIIPVLFDGADIPGRDELPEVLRGLTRRHAVRLDHETFQSDVSQLLSAIERMLVTDAQVPTYLAGSPLYSRPSSWRATIIENSKNV